MAISIPKPTIIRRELVPEPDADGNVPILLPERSNILGFGLFSDRMCFWYVKPVLSSPEVERTITRHLKIVQTGQEFDNRGDFVFRATIQTTNGIVWHCFVDKTPWQTYD